MNKSVIFPTILICSVCGKKSIKVFSEFFGEHIKTCNTIGFMINRSKIILIQESKPC